ncbi:excalibur calcium-binding domain-containing protein [Croceicoccus bisphenolivorans]|uniref:excalibur calcium-binding domain-containing protein n=1 Tax=Croceicoccus bisphenolivorans TaxID=1783232 RepID=UPI0008332073|nr:excalibur calcium-binding domain-containing protein [Croceicoccus bisphenolivorans]
MNALVRRLPIPLIVGTFLLLTQTGWFDGVIKVRGGDDPVYMSEDNPWAISGEARSTEAAVWFGTCGDANRRGHSAIARGEPGYRDELDPDGDGIAC